MYKPWTCRKCGKPMYGPSDHETTAGCAVSWPQTITTADTSGLVLSDPYILGSEERRKLARYDEAIRLLRAEVWTPALCWTDRKEIIEAFLAAEPADKETT